MNEDGITRDAEKARMNTHFFLIINNFRVLTKADKGNYIRAFESLPYRKRFSILNQLDEYYDDADKVRFLDRCLIDEDSSIIEDEYESRVKRAMYDQRIAIKRKQEIIFGSEDVVQRTVQQDRISAMEKLEKLTGLESVKSQIKRLIAFIEMSKLREKHGLKSQKQSLHMMFKGNPGTGKTTVARLLGQVLKEIGILESGHVIEIDRSNLISKFQGEIENKIKNYVEQAKGGILFIDEIYSLYKQRDDNDQGKQGVEVLLKAIEDNSNDFICIGAGYNEEVDTFLSSNPGLPSRFAIHINFEDYTEEELTSIAIEMFKDRDYTMDKDFESAFKKVIAEEKQNENFGNGRVVRNIVESSIREQSFRLWNDKTEKTKESLMGVTKEDLKYVPVKLKPKEDDEMSDIKRLTKIIEAQQKQKEQAI